MLKCLKTHPDVHGDDDVTAQILDKRIMPTNSEVSRPSPRVTMLKVTAFVFGMMAYLFITR
jgi:hypothetical protein